MVDTPNIKVTHVEVGQLSKETTVNTGADRFDTSNNDNVDIVTTAGGTIVVTEADYLDNVLLHLTGTPGGSYNLEVPDGNRAFKVVNSSGQTADIDTNTGSTPISLPDGMAADFCVRSTVIEQIGSNVSLASLFGRRSEVFPAAAMFSPGTQGAAALVSREISANNANHVFIPFITGTEERVQFGGVPFPNRWDKGTITFQVGYYHVGGQTGGLDGVSWELSAVSIAHDELMDQAFGSGVNVTKDFVTGEDLIISDESAVVTIGGTLADGNPVYFQLVRDVADGGDDLDIDARLLYVTIFWTEDAAIDD